MANSLENDMLCLVDSLKYLEDDSQQQMQALEFLADMCLQEQGSELFNKTSGLLTVFKLILNKKTKPDVVQKALFTLGNAVLQSDTNKGIVCSDQMLSLIQTTMLDSKDNIKLIASSSYFLSCLCTGNERAQNKARKSKCLERLVNLYRSFHPRGDSVNNNKQVEEWFDNVDGDQSAILLNHISYALRSMINKPQNCENQMICSRLMNIAISSLTGNKVSVKSKIEALQFISDCLYENSKVQKIFDMVGGLRYISQCMQKELSNVDTTKKNTEMLSAILDTLTAAVAENTLSKTTAGKQGIVKYLLDCLEKEISDKVQLKCLICLSDIVHENELCQQKMSDCDGISLVINIMSRKQDDLTSKIGTAILQSCVNTLSDLQSKQNASEEKDQPLSLSNLLSYFTGKKEEKEQQKDEKPKSIKALLRNLQMKTNLDPETSEHIKKIIAHIEAETSQKKRLPSNLKESGHLIKRRKLNNGKTIKNETNINKLQQDMMTMLKEQKQLMCTFQADINQLRHEISSQVASDSGGSAVIRGNHQLESTTIQSIRESTPQLKEQSLGVPQDQRKQIPMPFRKNSSNQLAFSDSSQTNPGPILPSPKVSTPGGEQHFSNLQPPEVSRRNMTVTSESLYSLSNTTVTGNNHYILENVDERPALEKYPKQLQNESFTASSLRTSLPKNFHNQIFKQTSTFEKVEQWRQTLPQQPVADVDVFKVPIGTPASSRQKSLDKSTPMPLQRRKRTPNDCIGKQKQRFDFLQYAPKKPHQSQKRREEGFHDDLAVSLTYTPEDKKVHLDQTKRILNFPKDARRKIGFKVYEDVKFEREPCKKRSRHMNDRQSSSSGFVEGSSKGEFLNDDLVSNNICDDKGPTVSTSKTCIGCNPNHVFLSHNFDCRNIILFFTTSAFSCQFHRDYIAKYKNLICKKVSKRQKTEIRHLQAQRNYVVKDKEKWENLSVFSFRSGTDMKNRMDDDQMSGISSWTVNTSATKRRQRQDYTDEEIKYLVKVQNIGDEFLILWNEPPIKSQGIERYGTRWTVIRNAYPFKPGRNAVDLSDKYKQLKRRGLIIHNKLVKCKPFTTQEIVDLRRGVFEYGHKWDVILRKFDFEVNRTSRELQQKWLSLMRRSVY